MSPAKDALRSTLRSVIVRYGSVRRNRGAPRKALLSFIIHPLLRKSQKHPNALELDLILSALEELGYEVTVVDYRRRSLRGRYDLCIGFGTAFETAMRRDLAESYVLYATGLSFPSQIQGTMAAMARVAARGDVPRGQASGFVRLPEALWPLQLVWSDAVLAIGGKHTISDHAAFCPAPIITAPGLCFVRSDHLEIGASKDFTEARRHFAWFGGPGFSHKGLDLCIDYFLKEPEVELHIAGAVAIPESYMQRIDAAPNIHTEGHLKIGSDRFRAFARRCGFVILPSCSEGMATSVVTMMINGGLVPIVSRQSSFDLPQRAGFELDFPSSEALRATMDEARALSASELALWSQRAEAHALTNFHPDVFRAAVIEAIRAALARQRTSPQTDAAARQ